MGKTNPDVKTRKAVKRHASVKSVAPSISKKRTTLLEDLADARKYIRAVAVAREIPDRTGWTNVDDVLEDTLQFIRDLTPTVTREGHPVKEYSETKRRLPSVPQVICIDQGECKYYTYTYYFSADELALGRTTFLDDGEAKRFSPTSDEGRLVKKLMDSIVRGNSSRADLTETWYLGPASLTEEEKEGAKDPSGCVISLKTHARGYYVDAVHFTKAELELGRTTFVDDGEQKRLPEDDERLHLYKKVMLHILRYKPNSSSIVDTWDVRDVIIAL